MLTEIILITEHSYRTWNPHEICLFCLRYATVKPTLKLNMNRIDPQPWWRAPASPESLLCCSVQECRQESSPVSLWSSGQGSARWWSYWRKRWTSPRSCHCSSECADICHTPYVPGRGRWEIEGHTDTAQTHTHKWQKKSTQKIDMSAFISTLCTITPFVWNSRCMLAHVDIFLKWYTSKHTMDYKGLTWYSLPVNF